MVKSEYIIKWQREDTGITDSVSSLSSGALKHSNMRKKLNIETLKPWNIKPNMLSGEPKLTVPNIETLKQLNIENLNIGLSLGHL